MTERKRERESDGRERAVTQNRERRSRKGDRDTDESCRGLEVARGPWGTERNCESETLSHWEQSGRPSVILEVGIWEERGGGVGLAFGMRLLGRWGGKGLRARFFGNQFERWGQWGQGRVWLFDLEPLPIPSSNSKDQREKKIALHKSWTNPLLRQGRKLAWSAVPLGTTVPPGPWLHTQIFFKNNPFFGPPVQPETESKTKNRKNLDRGLDRSEPVRSGPRSSIEQS